MIGTVRSECLDYVIAVEKRHPTTIRAEYSHNSNSERPHRTLRLETPQPQPRWRAGPGRSVRARPVLGGLHHVYEWAA